MLTMVILALQLSAPALISTIDTGKLKGEPTQLAWSAEGDKLFLQTSERDSKGMVGNHRYFVMSASEGKPESVSAPPAWATDYWTWKSNQFAPGSKTFGIDTPKPEERQATATSTPMGGDLARGGVDSGAGGTSAGDVASRAQQMQKQMVITLRLKGETIGEFVGQQFLPGYTFGWSPRDQMVAYSHSSGKLAVMSEKGDKQQVDGTKNVILPAWSPDGQKIAFLQKAGQNKYELYVVTVTQ
jgi:hypothetical protein